MKILFSVLILLTSWALRAGANDDYLIENISLATTWDKVSKNSEQNVRYLIELLKKSHTGTRLLKEATMKAAQSGETIFDVLKAGEGSLTDTTLVRKFSQFNPHEIAYETKSKVYINRDLSLLDALLDTAHELTHYTYRSAFNPYTYKMTVNDFIASTIEGTGGEVDAFMMECKVLFELFPTQLSSRHNCRKIQESGGSFSRTLAVQEFYKVGSYLPVFEKELSRFKTKTTDTQVSQDSISFISSAYGAPYPLAAVREYMAVMSKVCENDKKRFAFMEAGTGRTPTSSVEKNEDKYARAHQELLKGHSERCQF
ncbi:MAG: hypothetical protein ACOYL6_00275 [Bacteriovoracaceae bacterium]